MATKKTKKNRNKQIMTIVAVAVIIVVVAVVAYVIINNPDLLDFPEDETEYTAKPKADPALLADIDEENRIIVHFIDVGQGDSILIELGDDTVMLIDAGHETSVSKAFKADYLAYLDTIIGDGNIDYLIATHPDSDHINMLTDVIEKYDVAEIYFNDCYNDGVKGASKTLQNFETAAESEENCTVYEYSTADDTIQYINGSDYKLTIYSSGNDGFKGAESKANSMSILCLLEYGGRRALFTGDAEDKTEEWFVAKCEELYQTDGLDIDFLKVGHHGSRSCSSETFLDYIKPEYAVISCGKDNTYGHPHAETIEKLDERNITTYMTVDQGTIDLYIDSEGDFCFVFPDKTVETNVEK